MPSTLEANQDRLQLYLDGELDGAARLEVEAALVADPSLAAELARMQRMRSLLQRVPEALEVPLPSELAFERVLRNIHAELDAHATTEADAAPPAEEAAQAAPVRQPARVVPIDHARRLPRSVIGGIVAFAAAAAVAVVTLVPGRQDGNQQVAGTTGAAIQATTAARALGTEIIGVEFGKSSGTYWEQSEGSDRVAIVWIDDTMPSEVARP